jgi:ADP-heptose:LPS heptosyltransferase
VTRALIVRIGALGDVLLTRRLAHSLSLGGFEATLLAPARHAKVLRGDPWIHEVLDADSARFAPLFSGSWPLDPGSFDVAVVISNSADLSQALVRAAARVIRIAPEPRDVEVPIARQWARGMEDVCVPFEGVLPDLKTSAEQALLPGAVLIHPGSGSPSKNWRLERFSALARALQEAGRDVAWIRGPAESSWPDGSIAAPAIDAPSLDVLAATLARSALFIGNDSGVAHLAAATGTPTLALFGPTSPKVWRPDGARVRAVRAPSGALDDVSVETVLEAVRDLTRLEPTR